MIVPYTSLYCLIHTCHWGRFFSSQGDAIEYSTCYSFCTNLQEFSYVISDKALIEGGVEEDGCVICVTVATLILHAAMETMMC